MNRARIVSPGSVVLEKSPVPRPGPGEVLIRVKYCGICGSDIHSYHGEHPFIELPVVPGHEFSGFVEEAGGEVTGIRTGIPVTVEPQLVCGVCRNCRRGRYNICEKLRVLGCQADGAMAEYIAVPWERVVPLPGDMDLKLGALVEPLAVAVHAVSRGELDPADKVLIMGAGTIGLCVLLVARAMGNKQVCVIDRDKSRLEWAGKLGAERTCLVTSSGDDDWENCVAGSGDLDLVFECSGSGELLSRSIGMVPKGSRLVIIGVFGQPAGLPVGLIQDGELELFGSLMYTREDYEKAIDLIYNKIAPVGELITHEFTLRDVVEAFRLAADPNENRVKVVVRTDEN